MGFQNPEMWGGFGKKQIYHDLFVFKTNPLSWGVFKAIPREVFEYMDVSLLKNFWEPVEKIFLEKRPY